MVTNIYGHLYSTDLSPNKKPMNPSSFNQNFRRYSQDTCDLMIEDKKSPFPTWMNFNKPNPLKFSLGLTDPDRPEQSPIRITGDRPKLEALHQAVESYVGDILAKTPLPELDVAQSNEPASQNFKVQNSEALVSSDRPIDALNITGDQPYLEADGLSRHLLYLGNIATDNQVMVSLTTLQLFDLSSTLAEGILPVENSAAAMSDADVTTDLGATVANPPLTGELPTVEILQPEVVPAVTNRFANNVAEPRVVKSVTQDMGNSDEFSNIGADSSIHQNDEQSQERFKLPNMGIKTASSSSGNSNFPDFASPLSSIWPWLGVGTAAAGIIALSLFGGKEGNMFAGKPTVSPPSMAKASTAVGEYQPDTVPLPSGISSSPSATVTLNPKPSASVSLGLPGTTIASPNGFAIPSNAPILLKTPSSYGSSISSTPSSLSVKGARNAKGAGANRTGLSGNTTDFTLGSKVSPSNSSLGNQTVPRGEPVGVGSGGNRGFNVGNGAPDTDLATSTDLNTVTPTRRGSNSAKTAKKQPIAPAAIDDSLPGSVAASGDLFSPNDSKTNNAPIDQLPTDNNINPLETPDVNAGDSLQATETQSHFQKRWKADPNFSETLQYVIRLDKNGKVGRITPQGDISKNYLDKTRFLRTGEKLVSASRNGKDQDVRVLLKPNGEVETIVEP
jgi:Domain of unknown function (DUF4335)